MRALAVMLVLAAHAGVPYGAGGFVGVDVFFVISGYLITALLSIELRATGTIRLAAFYTRRLRRLLPTLLLVLGATAAGIVFLLPRSEHPAQAIAGASAAAWLSNLHFAFADIDYFGPVAEGNLFLHTWSLGVEEQFYLVWPAMLLLLMPSVAAVDPFRRLRHAMVAVLVAGFGACVWLSFTSSQLAFYLMPTRAWQFALGALVWFARDRRPRLSAPHAGWLGLSLLAVATTMFDQGTAYPGWRAAMPTLGAGLLILSGLGTGGGLVVRCLSSAPMRALGRVSYGWYLWHWPVLLLGRELFPDGDLPLRLFLVAVAWALATLTHHLVERPIRDSAFVMARPGGVLAVALAIMAGATLSFANWHQSATDWLETQKSVNRYVAAKRDVPAIYALGCDDWYHSADLEVCRFGPAEARPTVAIIGDSIGLQWFPALRAAVEKRNGRLLVLTKSSCPIVDGPAFFYPRIGRDYTECVVWRERAIAAIKAARPDVLLIGSSANYGFDERQWTEGTAEILRGVTRDVGQLHLIRATPVLPFDGPACLARALEAKGAPTACEAGADDTRQERIWHWLGNAARRFGNAGLIDMNDLVCPSGACAAERDGQVVYRDTLHLTATFAASLAEPLAARIGLDRPPPPR